MIQTKMGRKLIIIFKIRKKQEEQGVGGELRAADSLGGCCSCSEKEP